MAHALGECGVDLGPEERMLAANEFNEDGYWENRDLVVVNDALLAVLDGAWDLPPILPASWEHSPQLEPLRVRALDILKGLDLKEPWAWKDPRSSLTIAFWRSLFPGLKLVVCVRDPREVVRSLQRRGASSHRLGYQLWLTYNREILKQSSLEGRVVTHYESYFSDPSAELRRVLGRLGLSEEDEVVERAASIPQSALRHHLAEDDEVASAEVPRDVALLYRDLCSEAEFDPELAREPTGTEESARTGARSVLRLTDDVGGLRQDRDAMRAEVERLTDDVGELRQDRDAVRAEVERLAGERDGVERRLHEATEQLDHWRLEAQALAEDRDAWRVQADRLERDRDAWKAEAERFRGDVQHLVALSERRWSRRAKRAAFRIAHRSWLILPSPVRDFLLPRLLRRVPAPAVLEAVDAQRNGASAPAAAGGRTDSRERTWAFPTVPDTVSVVIPTLNAGPEFDRHLAAIREQEGLGGLELIVADSGSSDGTCERAEAAGARVLRISPGEFSHGRTRNRAVELARGDVVVMTVQDAIFIGAHALRDLVLELHSDPRLAGVSARQLPRCDADLYGAYVVWAHYHALWPATGAASVARSKSVAVLERRAAAALDNVCAAIWRTAWEELRFSDVSFAEDLDFGIRAVRRGWRIGLSDRTAVAHSHRRDAAYHLRRGIADRLYVAPLVGDNALSQIANTGIANAVASARRFLWEVEGAVCVGLGDDTLGRLAGQLGRIRAALGAGAPRRQPTGALSMLDDQLVRWQAAADGPDGRALTGEFHALLGWPPLVTFAEAQRVVTRDEAGDFAANLAASIVGRALGDTLRRGKDSALSRQFLEGV